MSKCKITGKVLAIQLGREDTQIVLMGKGKEILHAVTVQTPAGAVEDGAIRNPDAVRTMLKTAIKEEPAFKRVNQAVFSLCTSQVISETVTTPELPDAKLEKLLQANVDMYFPVDMHDYQLVWQRIGPVVKENGLKELAVQLWAVPTSMLARYYSVGNACGLSVVAVDYCGHSIASAVGASFTGKEKTAKKLSLNMEIGRSKKKQAPEDTPEAVPAQNPDTDMYLTMEKDLIGMTFVQAGTVVFQRFIRCGADPSYQLGELAMMVDYFSTMDVGRGSTVTVIPCGALCNNRALMGEVEDTLGMLLAAYPADHDPRFVLAMGAVRTTLDFGIPALNKPGKVRKDLQASLWQYMLILAGGLALVAVIMMLLSSRIVWNSEIGRLKTTQQTLTIQAQKTAGFADNYKAYSSKYDSYSADWDTIFASLQTYNDNLVLVLEELEAILPKNSSITDISDRNTSNKTIVLERPDFGLFNPSQYFQTHGSSIAITGIQIAPDGMNIQFACENKEEAAYLIMALRELEYMDLIGITDLQGGGSGPADSYGSGTEAAPTEGGSSGDNAITNLVRNELSKEELTALAGSMTDEEIEAMEKAYGAAPGNSLGLAEYKAANNPSFDERKNAMELMLTTNPFAANRFVKDLMVQDFWRNEEGCLVYLILDDFLAGNVSTEIITRDEETLTGAEKLCCTDESITNVEGWYVYYLETQSGAGYPYLDMDKLAADLMDDGHFNTGSDTLNPKLDALISDETRDLLVKLNSEEEIGKMVNAYFTTGDSGYPVVNDIIEDYLKNGETGIPAVDEKINAYIHSDAMAELISNMVDDYLEDGKTESPVVDEMIAKYLETGHTGNDDINAIIESYLQSEDMQKRFSNMFLQYLETGKTDSPVVTELIEKYLAGEITNPVLNDIIDSQLENEDVQKKLMAMGANYLTTGTTGNETLNAIIKRYNETGDSGNETLNKMFAKIPGFGPQKPSAPTTTGHEVLDELIKRYNKNGKTSFKQLNTIFGEYDLSSVGKNAAEDESYTPKIIAPTEYDLTDEQAKKLLEDYLINGPSGKETDTVIENYLLYSDTGSSALNAMLNDHLNEMLDQVEKLVNKYFKDGTSGIAVFDEVLENYFLTHYGTQDNVRLCQVIGLKLDNGKFDEAIKSRLADFPASDDDGKPDIDFDIEEIMNEYIENGKVENAAINAMIEKYLTTGKTGAGAAVDEKIDAYIASGKLDGKVKEAYNLYTILGIVPNGNKTIEKLFSNYYNTGSTGNAKLTKWFKNLGLKKAPASSSQPSSGTASTPKDTRVFFNAVLGYNDQLKDAELIRKGLYYGDKIDKLEVEE